MILSIHETTLVICCSTHALCKRNERNVKKEHLPVSEFALDNLPAVVLRAPLIAALAPVIEGQACLRNSVSHGAQNRCGC